MAIGSVIEYVFLLCVLASVTIANVEKIIFTSPPPSKLPITNPVLTSLNVHALSHNELSIRTELGRTPVAESSIPHGQSTWLLLTNLTENQRYELRVCWSALEPTRFDMGIYTPEAVLESPKLLNSITTYSVSRQNINIEKQAINLIDGSSLLLEVQVAADYYTDNKLLMLNPPSVLVDLILDPLLLNVLPQSLVPTVGYLVLLGIVTWFVARSIASGLQAVAGLTESQAKKQN